MSRDSQNNWGDGPNDTNIFTRWRAKRTQWLASMTPKERILRRVLTVASGVSVVVITLGLIYAFNVKAPTLPVDNVDANPEDDVTLDGEEPPSVAGRKDGFYTFLVCGRDTGGGGNTDTMLLATYDVNENVMNVMSIPRDTMVNVKWSTKKINSVYGVLGMEGLQTHVGKLTGVTPDFYVIIEWEAVGKLVDAIGGVDFDVPYKMNYDDPAQDLYIHVDKGLQHLDGDTAMQVIRWRKNNDGSKVSIGDTGRMEIQQGFLAAVAKECLQMKNITKVSKLSEIFTDNVETDLTVGNLVWFGQQAMGMDTTQDLTFCTLPANMNGSYRNLSYVYPIESEILTVVNEKFNPYLRDIVASDLQIMVKNKDGSLSVTSGSLADPSAAVAPTVTKKPVEEPVETDEPVETEPPVETVTPTETPVATETPEPTVTDEPVVTPPPIVTDPPVVTKEPPVQDVPENVQP